MNAPRQTPIHTPLSTSKTVKQAMLRDLGSRDADFRRVKHIASCDDEPGPSAYRKPET